MADYKRLLDDAPNYRDELEKILNDQTSDFATHYENVARAFPSESLHSLTPEFNIIDDKSFKLWAKQRGWKVKLESNSGADVFPPVIFSR